MSEERSCSGAVSKRKYISYNLDMKLDVISCKQKGKHVTDTAHALQVPETMIHTTSKSAQKIETETLKKVKITCQSSDEVEVSGNMDQGFISKTHPVSLALIQEKAI
jgi:hypothetical protein